MPADFYDLLDVSPDASSEQLRRAYREKARQYHPDVNTDVRSNDQFRAIRSAYDVLSDANERADYDRVGHREYVETRLGGTVGSTGTRSAGSSGDSTGRTHQGRGARNATPTGGRARPSGSQSDGSSRPRSTWGSRTIAEPGARARAMRTSRRSARPAIGVIAGLGYLLGLSTFLLANEPAFDELTAALETGDPSMIVSALFAGGLDTAWVTVERAVASPPSASLLFPVGLVAYSVFLGVESWRTGRSICWVWACCAFGPLLGVGLDAATVTSTVGVDLLLFAGLPTVALLGPFVVAVRSSG